MTDLALVSTTDPLDVQLGSKLLQARTLRRLTREELGRELGVSHQQIAKYESGENRIASATLCRCAKFLRIQVAWFFEGLDADDGDAPRALDAQQLELLDQFDRISDPKLSRIFIHFTRAIADALLRAHESGGAAGDTVTPLRGGVEELMR